VTERVLEAIDAESRRSGIIDVRRQRPNGQLHQLVLIRDLESR
jgi:hypothetical protein